MSGGFGIDSLVAAVREQRARTAGGDAGPVRPVADPGEDPARRLRRLLEEHRNCKCGVPMATGAAGPRTAVRVTKKIFRRLMQPFIDEMFERQLRFNDALCDLAGELLDRTEELQQDVRSLEAQVEMLRDRLAAGAAAEPRGEPPDAPRPGSVP